MRILSVIPRPQNPQQIVIKTVKDGMYIDYIYSEVHELLRDPNNPMEWCQWNGGTLTEAISYVISLPGSEQDNFSISKPFTDLSNTAI